MGITVDDKKALYREDNNLVELPDDFYSTDFYTAKMMEFISGNYDDGQPFFAYLSYTAPHWPLQAPEDSIAKYKGKYDAGYDVIHQQRIERLKQKGFFPEQKGFFPESVTGWGEPAWEDLTDEQKKIEARKNGNLRSDGRRH